MTITIGRFSIDDCPYNIVHQGDRLSFMFDVDGSATGGDADVAKMYRQQLLGLVGNDDEPVVPVIWSDDSDFDGYYRIESLDVTPTPVYLNDSSAIRHFSVSVTAVRVSGGYAEPVHELFAVLAEAGALTIDTGVGGTFGGYTDGAVYLPNSHVVADNTTVSSSRTAQDGATIYEVTQSSMASDETAVLGVSATVDPADFYDAAASVEWYVGGTWWPIVGRQVPSLATLRLNNGLVRVAVETDGEITVEHYDGSSWSSKGYTVSYDTGSGTINGLTSARVLMNGPDKVIVQFICTTSSIQAATLTVELRRGERTATFTVSTYSSRTWKVTRSTTEAATALVDDNSDTYGVKASSNDANGDQFVIFGRDVGTADTTNGGLTLAASAGPGSGEGFPLSSNAVFGLGAAVGGTGSSDPNSPDALGGRFQIAVSMSRSVST